MQRLVPVATGNVQQIFLPLEYLRGDRADVYCLWQDEVWRATWYRDGDGMACWWTKCTDNRTLVRGVGGSNPLYELRADPAAGLLPKAGAPFVAVAGPMVPPAKKATAVVAATPAAVPKDPAVPKDRAGVGAGAAVPKDRAGVGAGAAVPKDRAVGAGAVVPKDRAVGAGAAVPKHRAVGAAPGAVPPKKAGGHRAAPKLAAAVPKVRSLFRRPAASG